MKRYSNAKKLRKAPQGHYWIRGKNGWDIGCLWRAGTETFFWFHPPHGYFGGGTFGLDHEELTGAVFVGPIPEPAE